MSPEIRSDKVRFFHNNHITGGLYSVIRNPPSPRKPDYIEDS